MCGSCWMWLLALQVPQDGTKGLRCVAGWASHRKAEKERGRRPDRPTQTATWKTIKAASTISFCYTCRHLIEHIVPMPAAELVRKKDLLLHGTHTILKLFAQVVSQTEREREPDKWAAADSMCDAKRWHSYSIDLKSSSLILEWVK